jgi:uncharacterized membrane protein
METTTLYENGDTFEITYKRAETREPNKNYIYINEVLHEVISKIKTNTINVTKMNKNIWQRIKSQ